MVDVVKLLEYNETIRNRYFETLAKLSWKELAKNREASFHSMKNIFVHFLRRDRLLAGFPARAETFIRRRIMTSTELWKKSQVLHGAR